jgi:hypothetical protein
MSWMIPRPMRYLIDGLYYPTPPKNNEVVYMISAMYAGATAFQRTDDLIRTGLRTAGLGVLIFGQMLGLSENTGMVITGVSSPQTLMMYGSCKLAMLGIKTLLGANSVDSLTETGMALGYIVGSWALAEIHDFKLLGPQIQEIMKKLPGEAVIDHIAQRNVQPLTREILKGK